MQCLESMIIVTLLAGSGCVLSAQIVPVTPRAACAQSAGVAFFGYTNINAQNVTVPMGENNFFLQFPLDRGQGTQFYPGDYQYVFVTLVDKTEGIIWDLNNAYADASEGSMVPVCPAAVTGPEFGPIGLAAGETLRLKVVSNGSCTATLSFADRNGAPIGPAPASVNLQTGQIGFLDLTGVSLGLTTGQRVEIQPQIGVGLNSSLACQPSVEIIGSASQITLGAEHPQTPQVQPVFAAQGLSQGQTLRLNVAAPVGYSCTMTLSFTDANNTRVGLLSEVALASGESAYLDLPSTSVFGLGGWTGKRVELRPNLSGPLPLQIGVVHGTFAPPASRGDPYSELTYPSLANVCLATTEVFNTFSGATTVIANAEALP